MSEGRSAQAEPRESRDVIIVGSGPIGLSCAIEARRRGLSHLVLEKGCFLQTIVNFPLTMTFFSTSERLEIGDVPFVSHGPKPSRTEALEYYRRVAEHWNLDIRTYEAVTGVSGVPGNFNVSTGGAHFRCRSVIVATGFYGSPVMMGVPGEDLPKVDHYYREPYPYVGRRLLVVGGGNSAVDAALETWRKGAEVTMATRGPSFDGTIKYWIRPDIENRIEEGSIAGYFNSSVRQIGEREVVLDTPGGEKVIGNDFVLAMTGYRPDYEFLAALGVECTDDRAREPVRNDETFESSRPGVFVAGVLCNGMQSGRWLIENSRDHATLIFDRIGSLFPEGN